MTAKEKLGQLFMMDFRYWGKNSDGQNIPFTQADEKVCKLYKNYNFGGFILFKENIENNLQTISLLRDLQDNIATPLFFGTDQEGGRVHRLKQGTSGCGNMAIAATDYPNNAYTMSKLIGDELYSLGINTNFAPVIDVNSNKDNPIIGVRSYSDNASVVTEYARESLKGLADAGVISCVKHFPGHGDTALDSHHSAVVLDKSIEDLEQVELQPFRKLASEYDMVMTAHISMPKLDSTEHTSIATNQQLYIPATLSYKIITKLLKESMGFKGLVVSDAMDMKAISTHFGEIEATKMAIYAGVDVVLMPVRVWCEDDVYKLEKLFDALEKEYLENKDFAKVVNAAYDKVITYKKLHKLNQSPLYANTLDEQLEIANNIVSSQKHQDTAFNIAKQSTTIIKNNSLVPFTLANNQRITILDTDRDRLGDFHLHLKNLIEAKNLDVDVAKQIISSNDKNISAATSTLLSSSDLVILVSANLHEFNQTYSDLTAINSAKTINIAAINPYDNDHINNIKNYVCIYGATSIDQTNYTRTHLDINIKAALSNIFTL
ncbi:glycoside hydrolase family 3 N-terminal domain-containing protein [Francisella adeliensis]|uniref:beta-N-acetylhexosaminidase n=1 Tax=Francisella adeliensis TaxID=2007306 RepID=A0A2Z4XYQ7_9GAMM|nr:glycoside hydrolase family 3 protein [Francisella adeliensis]AXA33796.1 beta-glucosidase [Francisella adeliensis]MBK2085695.1 glycoside hydrolase family 3 protein [Francisella adeliensis]MBK2097573.1 glycoside hydrolase family 3 protein [Francisella adeliensis]QIW12031.1 glycoside hydrolase family 3 protein [Francisella adeliensis]QIW13906.1 glycoside hydrolase family 3 protein [Francisella adeliensis]